MNRNGVRLGGRQTGIELVVDEQAPDISVGDATDEVLDINSAIAQGAAVAIGFCDLGLEGDDALKSRYELAHGVSSRGMWPFFRPDQRRAPWGHEK